MSERLTEIRRKQLMLRQRAAAQSANPAPSAPRPASGGRQIVPPMFGGNEPLSTMVGPLNTSGPGPTGFIDPELYRMGAIGRRFDTSIGAIPAGNAGEDVALSFGSGLVRGATALADLPGQAFNAIGGAVTGGMERAGIVSPQVAEAARQSLAFGPMGSGQTVAQGADTLMPGARQYDPRTTAGEYARTVGEFLPATIGQGPGGVVMGGVLPGLASEAAGQATEGTDFEPYARVLGALAPATIGIGTSKFQAMFRQSSQRPTIENLQATKRAAYQAVDDAGEVFTPTETSTLYQRVMTALDDANYVPGVDTQTDAALRVLERRAGQETTLGQLDRVRQNLWKRYCSAPNETGILDAIDAIDSLVASRAGTNELMQAARLANSRFKKAELLDVAFRRAADQTAATGSGGNILNKYRQAVTSIINNPKQAKWFSAEELDIMRNFVRGSATENVLRRVGKLAPGGNGLMLALNLGATAINPAMLGVTAIASGAKATADSMATRGAMGLMDMAAGVRPVAQPGPNFGNALAPLASSILNQ